MTAALRLLNGETPRKTVQDIIDDSRRKGAFVVSKKRGGASPRANRRVNKKAK